MSNDLQKRKEATIKELLSILKKESGLKGDDIQFDESESRILYYTQGGHILFVKKF